MNTKRWMARARIATVVLGVGTLAGCDDLFGSQKKEAPVQEVIAPGIHPVLVVVSQSGGEATVELHLKRVEVTERIASFQGELRYDAGKLALRESGVPQGITGASNEVEKGRLRFAGISVEGIEAGAVLRLTFSTTESVRAEHFELKMEELIANQGFQDLAPRIQMGARPTLSVSAP